MCVVTVFVPPKSLLISTKQHGVTSQKNTALKLTAVGTSSLSVSIINVRMISAAVFATDYNLCVWSPCGKEIPRDSSQRITVRELHEGNAK
jgi:hypothetical protein